MNKLSLETTKLAVIGLGYVGLPLAVEFGKTRSVLGFDINTTRVEALRAGSDSTLEVDDEELKSSAHLSFSNNVDDIADCNVYIVTVPTPIDAHKRPDLTPLIRASETIGEVLNHGDLVIYESTVYPGATEEDCVPVLERVSGLVFNKSFFAGYSPERINPGDKQHRLPTITKVTSGSTPDIAEFVDALYGTIITSGTYKATSIRVAEAAKVIENTQRDVNIALINELAIIFDRMGIDTESVLRAAATKWNFLPFRPGLVGGHCIGVDPYYLTHKAKELGYNPMVILSGRRINDDMAAFVAQKMVKALLRKNSTVKQLRVLILGLTFKENCPDIRNTKIIDLIAELQDFGIKVDVHDPWVDPVHVKELCDLNLVATPQVDTYDGVILSVAHDTFRSMGVARLRSFGCINHVFYDLKSIFSMEESDLRL